MNYPNGLQKFSFNKILIIGGCLFLNTAFAGGPETPLPPPSFLFLPTLPGVSLYGLGGNGWTAIGDAMVPVVGQPLNFTYIDPQIYYHSHDSEFTASIGAGQRWLFSPDVGIVGAYIFGDYNHSLDSKSFWFVSPGVERLGQLLDFSANLYIPVSSQRQDTGLKFADEIGDFSQIHFSGHDQIDELVDTFESTGWGGDAQIGVRLPYRNAEVFFGGYYFSPKDSDDNVGGGAVRLQVPINDYIAALVSDAYDSQFHNTVKGGITIWFGGRHTGYHFSGNLAERLVDPIQRNLVAVAGGSHTGQPILENEENTGQTAVEMSNISFFIPPPGTDNLTAVQGDGTFENPYVNMTQDNVNDANNQDNRNFYIESGTYNAVYNSSNPDYIVLNNDQLFGRFDDFRQEASGNNRAFLNFANGGFEIPDGDVNDSIRDLRLNGQGSIGNAGVWIDHATSASNVVVNLDDLLVQGFGDGVDALNSAASSLTLNIIDDSQISNNNSGGEFLNADFPIEGGIAVLNSGTGVLKLKIDDSNIVNNTFTLDNANFEAVGGVAAVNLGSAQMTIDVSDSNVSNNTVNSNNSSIVAAGGMAVTNDVLFTNNTGTVDINVNRSNISGNSFSNNVSGDTANFISAAGGLAAVNDNMSMTINISGSDLNQNSVINNVSGEETSSAIGAEGGLAVASGVFVSKQQQPTNAVTNVNIEGSNLSDNSISSTSTGPFLEALQIELDAAGGFAVINNSNEMNINVKDSNFSKNSITNNTDTDTGSFIGAAGGIAAANEEGAMNINVKDSALTGNLIMNNANDNSISSISTEGGLAFTNDLLESLISRAESTVNISVKHSNLSKNIITNNATDDSEISVDAAGGLAVANLDQNLNIAVDSSNFNDNAIALNVSNSTGSDLSSAGGLAVSNSTSEFSVDIKVNRSSLSGNSISENLSHSSGNTITSAGGLAIADLTEGTLEPNSFNVSVKNSNLSNNSISADVVASSTNDINSAGGLAVNTGEDMNINVSHSNLSENSIIGSADNASALNIKASGGLAIYNLSSSEINSEVSLKLDHSNLNENSINLANAEFTVAGSLAVANFGGVVDVDVDYSNFLKNTITTTLSTTNSSKDALRSLGVIGGIALSNEDTMDVNIDHSKISENSIAATNEFLASAGGIAVSNDNLMSLDISHSKIINNSIDLTDTSSDSAGGVAITNSGQMSLDLDNSTISKNSVSINGTDNSFVELFSAGGLAVDNDEGGDINIDVSHSNLSGNSVITNATAHSDIEVFSAGGLAATNRGNSVNITIDKSKLSGNSISATSTDSAFLALSSAGGLAVDTTSAVGDMTLDVSHSSLSENTINVNGANTSGFAEITVAGGLAAENLGDQLAIDVSYSNLSENSIIGNTSGITTAAGGLAAVNLSTGFRDDGVDPTMSINLDHSKVNENSINGTNTLFDAAGGLAVVNFLEEAEPAVDRVNSSQTLEMNVQVNDSIFSKNTVSDASAESNDFTAGGIALFNFGGVLTADVNNSKISENSVDLTSLSVASAGGIGVFNNGSMSLDVSNSKISKNSVDLTNASLDAAGGIAISNQGNMTFDLDDSIIAKNSVSAQGTDSNMNFINAAGGLAISNSNNNVQVEVSRSIFAKNSVVADSTYTVQVAGGVAVINNSASNTSMTISQSKIVGNSPAGVDLQGNNLHLDLEESVVAKNANDIALIANDGATIFVSDPVFFNGFVFFNTPNAITFQGLVTQPDSGDKVFCVDGHCRIVAPK